LEERIQDSMEVVPPQALPTSIAAGGGEGGRGEGSKGGRGNQEEGEEEVLDGSQREGGKGRSEENEEGEGGGEEGRGERGGAAFPSALGLGEARGEEKGAQDAEAVAKEGEAGTLEAGRGGREGGGRSSPSFVAALRKRPVFTSIFRTKATAIPTAVGVTTPTVTPTASIPSLGNRSLSLSPPLLPPVASSPAKPRRQGRSLEREGEEGRQERDRG
jgi:hypothetical protein